MDLRDWRKKRGLTLHQLAELLGIATGANPSRRVNRIETGEATPDPLLSDKIVLVTGGEVTLLDLHNRRRDYVVASKAISSAATDVPSAAIGA